jgi:hypothetical protein
LKKILLLDDEVIGFEADGTPILLEDFVHSITEANREIEEGEGVLHSAMKQKYGART